MAKYQPAHKKAQPKLNLAKPAVTMAVTASLALSPVLQTAAFAESGTDANDDVKAEQKQASKEEIAAAKADVEKAQKAYDEAKANVEKAEKAYDEAKAAEAEAKASNQEAQNALEDAKEAVYTAQAQLADAEKALGEAQKAYEDAVAEADKLGTEYNENQYEKKAEDARAAADAKKAEWDEAVKAQNDAQVAFENAKNLTSEEEAQATYDAATKKADKLYQEWSDLDNAAAKAEQTAKDAEATMKADLKVANDAQVALEAAKKLPSVEDAEAALKAATKADDEAAAKFNELDNKALAAEKAREAKKSDWDAKLAEANEAQVAVANRKANEAARDEVYQKWSDKDNEVRRDQEAYNKSIDELQAANEALAAAKDACTAAKVDFDSDVNNMFSATDSGNSDGEQYWYNQAYGQGGSFDRYQKAQADVKNAQTAFTTAQDTNNDAYATLQEHTKELEELAAQKDAAIDKVALADKYDDLKADADKLGQEYNELDNEALTARKAADEANAAWHKTTDKKAQAEADLKAAQGKEQTVKDAQDAFDAAMDKADESGKAYNEALNKSDKAAKAAEDAKADRDAAIDEQVKANQALAAAKKKPQIVKAAEDALKAAAAKADKLGQEYNDLENEALKAKNTLDAKKAAWNKALAAANAAQVALADAQKAKDEAAMALEDANANLEVKSDEAIAAGAKYEQAQSDVLDAYANHQLAMQAQANALAQLNAAKKVLDSLVPYVEPTQPQVTTTTTTTTKTPAKDEKKADEAALPTTGDSAQVTIIAGLGAAAIAAGATRRRFNA